MPQSEKKLSNIQWNLIIQMQSGTVETHYEWTWMHTIKRREKAAVLVWHITEPIHLLAPENITFPSQYVWFTQPGQIPKAVTTLTSKDQAASVIPVEKDDLPLQVPMKYLPFQP